MTPGRPFLPSQAPRPPLPRPPPPRQHLPGRPGEICVFAQLKRTRQRKWLSGRSTFPHRKVSAEQCSVTAGRGPAVQGLESGAGGVALVTGPGVGQPPLRHCPPSPTGHQRTLRIGSWAPRPRALWFCAVWAGALPPHPWGPTSWGRSHAVSLGPAGPEAPSSRQRSASWGPGGGRVVWGEGTPDSPQPRGPQSCG